MNECILSLMDKLTPYMEFTRNLLLIIGSFVGFYIAYKKRKSIFSDRLATKQFDYLANLRNKLTDLSLDIHYVFNSAQNLRSNGKVLTDFETFDYEGWKKSNLTKDFILDLYHRGNDPHAYYIPYDFDFSSFKFLATYLKDNKLYYFSVYALGDKEPHDMENLSKPILKLRNDIDDYLKRNI